MKSETKQKGIWTSKIKSLIACFVLVASLFTLTLRPLPAKAQGVVHDPINYTQAVLDFLTDAWRFIREDVLTSLAAVAYKNGIKLFVVNLAAETAEWIASGDEGKKPLIFTDDWGTYLQNAGERAAATAVTDFAEMVGLGDVCVAPQVAIDILIPAIDPPNILRQPRCTLDDLRQTWDVTSPQFLENFTLSFETGQNDLGIAVAFITGIENEREKEEEKAEKEREDADGFKATKEKISQIITAPGSLIREKFFQAAIRNNNLAYAFTGDLVADTVDAFTSTLAGAYLERLKSGFFSLADVVSNDAEEDLRRARNALTDIESTGPIPGIDGSIQFKNLFRPQISQSSNFNILQELAACPTEVRYASLYNCTIDSSFYSAVQGNSSEGFLTVRQAVQQNLLHGEWAFGFVDPASGIEPSYINGYAYSNMKKLRKVRILPVGWEMAALRARQLGVRVTLQEMLDQFDQTDSPFYRLVDPNWVLKAPVVRCAARVASQITLPGGGLRLQECVDIQDCVAFGSSGECLSWGYCTHEKRRWDFPGEECADTFATCDRFVDTQDPRNNDNLWLLSTMQFEGCNADTAGCTWYSIVQNAAGEWLETNRIYLTQNVEECDADDAGCHEYIRMGNNSNLIRNGSFEDDGGHNYVLGTGDQVQENGVPDGWSARQSTVALTTDSVIQGNQAVSITSLSGGVCTPGLQYEAPLGSFEVAQNYTLSGYVRTSASASRNLRLSFQGITFTIEDVNDQWEPFAFSFIMPATSDRYTMVLGSNDGECADLNTGSQVFYDAIQLERGTQASIYKEYGSANKIYLNNAPSCTFEEVGCQQYVPADRDLGIEVTGIATGADVCPEECSGYASYEQRETGFEPARFENFIASTASLCRAQEVGCEQFTNLDEVTQGGEGLEFYSEIRHCEKPQESCSTYFAWEGSDTAGFQLMNYSLLAGAGGAPDMVDGSTSCDPDDSNCRELIGEDGARYVRDLTQTVTCSEACTPLRARAGLVSQAECEARRGQFDLATERCIFQAIPEQSQSCNQAAVGCREYIGNTGRNVTIVFNESFEAGTASGWTGGSLSTESTEVGGHSFKIGENTGSISSEAAVSVPRVLPGRSYLVELSAKSSVSDFLTVDAFLGVTSSAETRVGGFVTGTTSWNRYSLGPITFPAEVLESPFLSFEVTGASASPNAISLFIDDVIIREIKDSVFAVKDSWNTPPTCDTNPPLSGGSASRSMLGCQEYRIRGSASGDPVYLKSFTRLCSEEKIGCEAVLDTFNSDVPYREIFNEGDEAEIVVPEDQVRYIVNDDEYECEPGFAGCMELGKPVFDQENDITNFESVFYINDPDTYETSLCKANALFCKEFQTSDGSLVYAKHPGLQQCEYREVPNSFPPRMAWFKVGSTEENPDDCLQAAEATNGYVQRCPANQISCTQFFEPITEDAFYYKKNSLLNTVQECNGVIDWKQGCVLFRDLSQRDLTFKSGEDVDFIGAPEPCQTGDQGCNTNVLMKVNLNRECTEWLTGVSVSRYWDTNLQEYRTVSYGLGRCLEADPVNPNICRRWDNAADKELLTIGSYQNRDTNWASPDLSGYSIPNLYPVETLRQNSVGFDEDGNPQSYRLTRLSDPGGSCQNTTDCPVGQVCRLELDPDTGVYEGSCYVEEGVNGEGSALPAECRGYPEETSPFPYNLAVFAPPTDDENPGKILSKKQQFKDANIGQPEEDVECNYNKVTFDGGEARYYSIDTIPPTFITVDGEEQTFDRRDTFIGWEGYCLETDPSRVINGADDQFACLSWYPVDAIQGAFDINNSDLRAGYLVGTGSEYYCVEAIIAEWRTTWKHCSRSSCGPNYTTTRRGSCAGREHNKRECNPIGGDGWYPYDGSLTGIEQLGVMCSKVARISDAQGLSAAWTTRILGDTLPGSEEFFVKDLGWGYDQFNRPYGAAKPRVTRLEELSQPLLVLNPNEYTADCEECEYPEQYHYASLEQTATVPFGVCQDDVPSRNGKPCPLLPNAGSPFAISSEFNPALINDDLVRIRRDNQKAEESSQPYPGSEDFSAGFERIQDLFAKSYGVWEWQSNPSLCVGECTGGVLDGEICLSDRACGAPEEDYTYTCAPSACIGGYRNGLSCTTNDDCLYPASETIHQCIQTQSETGETVRVCETGPFAGETCDGFEECAEENADGTCSGTATVCQAVDGSGNPVSGDNSGRSCNNSAECNQPGVCQVQRCSSDPEGTDSGLCTGKEAGEQCGAAQVTNQYTRLPVSNPASGWDLVRTNPGAAQAPSIRPVVSDPSRSTTFTEGFASGITVNGATSGTVAAQDGRAPVTVSFYAYNENGEQMPLRLVLVDWGDDSDVAEARGSFKNHKSICRKFCSNAVGISCSFDEDCQDDQNPEAQCLPFNFGDSDDACIDDGEGANGFFSFSHTYTCEGPDPCSFTPQVLVRDNWGASSRVSFNGEILVQPPLNPQPAEETAP